MHSLIRIILVITVLFYIRSVYSQAVPKTIFTGNFNNGDFIHFYYLDSIDNPDDKMQSFYRKSTYKSEITNKNYTQVAFNGNQSIPIYYFFFPDDTILIKIVSHENFSLSTKDTIRNNELNFQKKMVSNFGRSLSGMVDPMLKAEQNLKSISFLYSKISNLLIEGKVNGNISNKFYELYKASLTYGYINSLLYPVYYKSDFPEFIADTLLKYKNYFKYDEYISLYQYRNAAYHYLIFLAGVPQNGSNINKLIQACNLHFTGVTKDYLLARLYKESKNSITGTKIDSVFSCQILQDPFYKKFIKYNIEKNIRNQNDGRSDIVLKTDKSLASLKSVLYSSRGKYVYIDFWASWCIPCREEMKYYPQLIKRYKKKSIKFLYVSLDKDAFAWDKTQILFPFLNSSNSFLLNENFDSKFSKLYKINSIPRYFLFDKSGKLITADAPRPSDIRLQKLFDSL